MDSLKRQISMNAADYAVEHYGPHLPKNQQSKLWQRYFDSVLAALITFEEIEAVRHVRTRALISEN